MRYTVQQDGGTYRVLDNGTPMGRLYSSADEALATRMAANLNAADGQAAEPAAGPGSTGWSTAARRRAGQTPRSHPLGRVVETGAGHTVYEDEAVGGGRVQIWDHS